MAIRDGDCCYLQNSATKQYVSRAAPTFTETRGRTFQPQLSYSSNDAVPILVYGAYRPNRAPLQVGDALVFRSTENLAAGNIMVALTEEGNSSYAPEQFMLKYGSWGEFPFSEYFVVPPTNSDGQPGQLISGQTYLYYGQPYQLQMYGLQRVWVSGPLVSPHEDIAGSSTAQTVACVSEEQVDNKSRVWMFIPADSASVCKPGSAPGDCYVRAGIENLFDVVYCKPSEHRSQIERAAATCVTESNYRWEDLRTHNLELFNDRPVGYYRNQR